MIGNREAPSTKSTVARGDVVEVDLNPVRGREMAKKRPCVVVTNNVANQVSPVVTVVAVSSEPPSKPFPFIVEIPPSANMPKRSWIDCGHIRTVDKSRLGQRYFTTLDQETMKKVNTALKTHLALDP